MEIKSLKGSFNIDRYFKSNDAEKIRGYLGNLFWDNPYAHQHTTDGNLMYQYPCVQYKVIGGACLLISFNEGIEVLKKAFNSLKAIKLDGKWEDILSKGLEKYTASFSIVSEQIHYSFLTPWLALNEKNYEKYQMLGTIQKRKKLLESILIGNIISISKSLGYTVPKPIKATILTIKPIKTSLKSNPMLGFLGSFSVNFEIPDYWGIGKSVSRGFGTVIKQKLK